MPGRHRAATGGRHRRPDARHRRPEGPKWDPASLVSICVVLGVLILVGVVMFPILQGLMTVPKSASTVTTMVLEPDPSPSRSYQPSAKPKRKHRTLAAATPSTTPAATQSPRPTASSTPSAQRTFTSAPKINPDRYDVIEYAKTQIGDPYVWGAEGPSSFDCSGLVLYSFARAGYAMPRFSGDQANMGNVAPISTLAPGDLLAWSGHVAIWLGNGKLIEAAQPGTDVRIRTFSPGSSSFDAQAWGVSLDYSRLPRL